LSLSSYFLSSVQLRRGCDRADLVGTWCLSRPNQNRQIEWKVTGGEKTLFRNHKLRNYSWRCNSECKKPKRAG